MDVEPGRQIVGLNPVQSVACPEPIAHNANDWA